MRVQIDFERRPLSFDSPRHIITCHDTANVRHAFQEMEDALAKGFYLAGFISYEAGYSFEEKFPSHRSVDFPLVYIGCYDKPRSGYPDEKGNIPPQEVSDLAFNISPSLYAEHIDRIRSHIEAGDVYQITYCLKALFSFAGSHHALYRQLLRDQPVPYPAYIEDDTFSILSLSPEMFVRKRGCHIVTKPMKGTWPRGGNIISDTVNRFRFQHDPKNRAENVMIADLLRNDLGRVGSSIRAPKLFEVARYRTLFQMTSTVVGRSERDVKLYDLFKALFPSGSVTGAPKIRAMEIIRDLEGEDRRIYTGAIGYVTPERDLFFNVPIRTLLIRDGRGEMGIGGGIVWDSTAQGEWAEGMLKAKFLTDIARP